MSLEQMTSRLAIMMGGRVAEELVFGQEKVTSGAASDIEQATKLARMMVTRWGLSERARHGRLRREPGRGVPRLPGVAPAEHLGRDEPQDRRRDPAAGRGRLCGGASSILTEKRADLETLAKGLLEFETLTGDEIKDLLAGKRPVRESVIEPIDAALLRGADRRQGPPRPEPGPGPLEPQPQA